MDIKDVFHLESGTIVQNVETKDRYIVYVFDGDKYLVKYQHRNRCDFITMLDPWEDISKIICMPTDKMIFAEYQILPEFKKRENFIYIGENETYYRGIILSVEISYYDVIINKKDNLEHFTIYQDDMWRMKKIK